MERSKPIAVFDGGIGGLTTVVEMQQLLPNEDIVYLADSKPSPFGNRPIPEIVSLTKAMLRFLTKQNVKAVVIACNTISTLVDYYRDDYDLPFVVITDPAAQYMASLGQKKVGIIATVATINGGTYDRLIHKLDPNIEIVGEGCKNLARLVDCGEFDDASINEEIRLHMDALLDKSPDITHVMLGCTHYPVVIENFQRLYPSITFINPARAQALAVRKLLEDNHGLNQQTKPGQLDIYTTGKPQVCVNVLKRLKGTPANSVSFVELT